jgi:hypothetical protein
MKTLAHSRKTGEGTVCALLELGGREGDPFSSASTAVRHDQMRQLTRATPSGSTGADHQVRPFEGVSSWAMGLDGVPVTSVAHGISGIVGCRAPVEVLGSVVPPVVVSVEHVRPREWRGSMECLGDQNVDCIGLANARAAEAHERVTITGTSQDLPRVTHGALLPSAPFNHRSAQGPDSPSTADFVQPLPPFDRNPLFTVLIHRYSPCAL